MKQRSTLQRTAVRLAALVLVGASLSGCEVLLLGGAVGGAFVATDRRTSGTQLEDQTIQVKARNRASEVLGERGHVNVNAYNRLILLTGEVPNEADRAAVEQAVARTENATGVVNELAVTFNSSLSSRASDVALATKVKATLVDARDLMSGAFDVVVERGEVYLMGIVTEREANRAAELISTISGVRRVVKVFQIISEDELARRLPKPATNSASGTQP
ncbi:MAG TPA: BON domain-containing protein [Aquabacterium sp.]|nr:BON domain-containing protein [Aquabacterium sp.]